MKPGLPLNILMVPLTAVSAEKSSTQMVTLQWKKPWRWVIIPKFHLIFLPIHAPKGPGIYARGIIQVILPPCIAWASWLPSPAQQSKGASQTSPPTFRRPQVFASVCVQTKSKILVTGSKTRWISPHPSCQEATDNGETKVNGSELFIWAGGTQKSTPFLNSLKWNSPKWDYHALLPEQANMIMADFICLIPWGNDTQSISTERKQCFAKSNACSKQLYILQISFVRRPCPFRCYSPVRTGEMWGHITENNQHIINKC